MEKHTSAIHSFIRSLTHLFIPSFVHSFAHSLMHSVINLINAIYILYTPYLQTLYSVSPSYRLPG